MNVTMDMCDKYTRQHHICTVNVLLGSVVDFNTVLLQVLLQIEVA